MCEKYSRGLHTVARRGHRHYTVTCVCIAGATDKSAGAMFTGDSHFCFTFITKSTNMPNGRYYCFTINNWTPEELLVLRVQAAAEARYICWQQEVGALGTPHLQGYVEYSKTRSLMWMKANGFPNRTHFEKRQGSRAEAREYTRKVDGTEVPGTWEEHGIWAEQGDRIDLVRAVQMVREGKSDREIIEEAPDLWVRNYRGLSAVRSALFRHRDPAVDKPTVRVLWGRTGTGKTRDAVEFASTRGLACFIHLGTKWWDGYEQQPVVVMDDMDEAKFTALGITYVLGLLDRYPFRVEIKGGSVPFNSPHIFITSNVDWGDWCPGATAEHRAALERRLDVVTFYP